MKGKVKSVLVIFFAATILIIGTGIIQIFIPSYKDPEPNYRALGMILLNINGGTAQSITGLDSETIAKIELQSLTREEIPEIKDKIQNSLNQGFQKWAKQTSIKFTLFNATSETVTPQFFHFLEENPGYKEAFKLYDKVLTQENDYKMQEFTMAILATDVNYVVQNGELLNQWNTTSEVNGTTYTSMFNEYSLDVNGTNLTVVKVTVMSSDGTVISDPYLYVHKWDLFYLAFVVISWWPFWGIYVPCPYGYDIYLYMRYPNEDPSYSESAFFLGKVWNDLVYQPQKQLRDVSAVLLSAYFLCLIPALAVPVSIAVSVVEGVLLFAGYVGEALGTLIYNEYLYWHNVIIMFLGVRLTNPFLSK